MINVLTIFKLFLAHLVWPDPIEHCRPEWRVVCCPAGGCGQQQTWNILLKCYAWQYREPKWSWYHRKHFCKTWAHSRQTTWPRWGGSCPCLQAPSSPSSDDPKGGPQNDPEQPRDTHQWSQYHSLKIYHSSSHSILLCNTCRQNPWARQRRDSVRSGKS